LWRAKPATCRVPRSLSRPTTLGTRLPPLAVKQFVRDGGTLPFRYTTVDAPISSEENVVSTAIYILGNPVRAGLVADFHDYPLCGSMEFDL
jgi:hypothetical protein